MQQPTKTIGRRFYLGWCGRQHWDAAMVVSGRHGGVSVGKMI